MIDRIFSVTFFILLLTVGNCLAQSDLLNRVTELQKTARLANSGRLGCGEGTITLATSNGELKVGVGLDPIHVFGNRIVVKDLLTLLKARVESNLTGEVNQMSGQIDDLAYVIFSTLAKSKDSTVIPVATQLLDDRDDVIRGWAMITLLELAESDEDLKNKIAVIEFPKLAVQSANGRGHKLPVWAKIKEELPAQPN